MTLLKLIRSWWWSRQRSIDMDILWPACKQQARDIDHARAAFAVHAFQDPAWIDHYGKQGLIRVIGELK
ncbi:MAG: hypothetical protein M0Z85_03815 [Gammaproteobacteria bacterium]|nr:hypothetical protein [Gammaproteobacteria bacterium]